VEFAGVSIPPGFTPPPAMPKKTTAKDNALIKRVHQELIDDYDEELEMEREDWEHLAPGQPARPVDDGADRASRNHYFRELFRLQSELVKMHDWIVETGYRLVIVFEGRDAAGKGGVIKRITQRLNPRVARVAALPAPTSREKTQWYFQRYVAHLPAAGEMVLFDRSWYNRAGVERVMGFCTDAEYEEFFRTAPEFEKMLVRSGIQVIKYWFSISDEEQEFRFRCRINDPFKQWKLSPMDLESRKRWELYTKAKEVMLQRTQIPEAPWWVVPGVDKKKARLNCIHHLLSQVKYREVAHVPITLPQRVHHPDYTRKPIPEEILIPQVY
jgi:polyphosphate kinase 2